jgi:hypothetical protein
VIQVFEVEWLRDVAERAELDRLRGERVVGIRGDHDDGNRRVDLLMSLRACTPFSPGMLMSRNTRSGCAARIRSLACVALTAVSTSWDGERYSLQEVDDFLLVVDHQNAPPGVHAVSSMTRGAFDSVMKPFVAVVVLTMAIVMGVVLSVRRKGWRLPLRRILPQRPHSSTTGSNSIPGPPDALTV